ncbi:hypothetical protein B6U91_01685 [Candidatus Pacearchaeota archaeon ex4484_71]|nr:MAG: hypothetical protein B6U91_01685 [Candidatus Pacearchaeota archaeon ex4484_71]
MAVEERIYFKKFKSETDHEDTSVHGSPDWTPYQAISKEHKELEEGLKKDYGLWSKIEKFGPQIHFGFDGKFQYSFWISGKPKTSEENPEKNVFYEARVHVKKAGKSTELNNPCDPEKKLLHLGFGWFESPPQIL